MFSLLRPFKAHTSLLSNGFAIPGIRSGMNAGDNLIILMNISAISAIILVSCIHKGEKLMFAVYFEDYYIQ